MVNFCEFDKYAAKSYCAIHGTDETLNLGDITKVDEAGIPPFNMICGGSPCQDFSSAGTVKVRCGPVKNAGISIIRCMCITVSVTGVKNAAPGRLIKRVLPCW